MLTWQRKILTEALLEIDDLEIQIKLRLILAGRVDLADDKFATYITKTVKFDGSKSWRHAAIRLIQILGWPDYFGKQSLSESSPTAYVLAVCPESLDATV